MRADEISADDDSSLNVAQSTRALIEDGYQFLYWIPSKLTGIPDWNLEEHEAKELATRTDAVIKSLGKRRAKKVIGAIDSYLPGFSLIAAAVIITAPRIKLTREVAARRVQKPAQRPAPVTAPGVERPADTAPASTDGADRGDGSGGTGGGARSLTVADIEEIRT